MARGFYDLAIGEPSKAALEAWGAVSNPSHQRVAKEADDPDVVAATRSRPGVVFKQASGVESAFRGALRSAVGARIPARTGLGSKSVAPKPAKRCAPEISERDARKPAADFEKEQQRRDAERRREEGARQRGRERREKPMAKAQAVLDKAEREHAKRAAAIQDEADALEKRSRAEDDLSDKVRERLHAALRRARTKQSADERVRLAVAYLFDQKHDSGGPASGDTFAFQPPGTLTWNLLPPVSFSIYFCRPRSSRRCSDP